MNAIDRAAKELKNRLTACTWQNTIGPHNLDFATSAMIAEWAAEIFRKHFAEPAERADQPVTERDWTIADCYATDPENWRDPWLLRIGFKPDDEQDYLWINSGHGCMFDLQAMAAGPWRLADEEGVIEIPRPKTRSDVLRLLAALGIPTPPQEQARG